jgi:hypothetical protein
MAIIKPSLKFEGSELNLGSSATPYIKDGVRRAIFSKTSNVEGAYLYFLPAYKADSSGNGIWYKRISVRDNFGTSYKEKYFIPNKLQDPAEYFANNLKILYPEESRVRDVDNNGKKFKQYPFCGRVTDRVVYNVAFAQNLSAGAHVLDLPLRNGADILMNWLGGKDLQGNPRNPINDPDRCVPVYIKLKEGSQNPWTVQVESSQAVKLPEQLADSDYLYDLDDVFVTKTKEDILAKLREMYSADIFDDCMNGYPGLLKPQGRGASFEQKADNICLAPVQEAPKIPVPAAVPVLDIPKASIAPVAVASVAIPAVQPVDLSSLPPNPMASRQMSREEALRFMNEM